ncbi:Uncharacterised protein [Escherichia coli]|nr:Uncharacterised protein [Escherichia coli]
MSSRPLLVGPVHQHLGGRRRPARSRAWSRISGRLVAARMISPTELSKPSISVSSWLRSARSRRGRRRARAARTHADETSRQTLIRRWRRRAPPPRRQQPWPAMSCRCPVGRPATPPWNARPETAIVLRILQEIDDLDQLRLGLIPPATSANVTPVFFSTNTLARLLPMLRNPPMPCFSAKRRNRKNQTPKKATAGRIHDSTSRSQVLSNTRA